MATFTLPEWPPNPALVATGQAPLDAIATDAQVYTVAEGGTVNIAVSLMVAPPATVTTTASRVYGAQGGSISAGSSLTFTTGNFATPQNVTFTAPVITSGLGAYEGPADIVISSPGFVPQRVRVNIVF